MMAVFASVITAPGNNHAAAYAATAVISTLIINLIMLILNKCSYSAFAIAGSLLQQNHYNNFLQMQQKAFIDLAELTVKIEIDVIEIFYKKQLHQTTTSS
jgi:hypothetical protein